MKESPLLLMKNALVNILGSFSLGYANRMPDFVNYGLALSGLVILSLLFSLRECWMILAIASTSICFAPYYPPIQAYMFGSFILLSFVAAKVLLWSCVVWTGDPFSAVQPSTTINCPAWQDG